MAKLTKQEQEALSQANKVWSMAQSEGWEKIFQPFLKDKLNQSFPDPASFSKEEEFVYAAKMASVFKKVIAELLEWVESQIETAKALEAKKKDEVVNKFRESFK